MEIFIHIEKRKLDPDYEKAITEYTKRLSAFCRVKIVCYKDFSRLSIQKGSSCFSVIPGTGTLSSEDFSKSIEDIALSGCSRIEYIIPSDSDIAKIPILAKPFCLSGFSMSADLSAVVLCEQLYRAYTIQNHITYHK